MKEYTLDDFLAEPEVCKDELVDYAVWYNAKPQWWRFRARRRWKKAEPIDARRTNDAEIH